MYVCRLLWPCDKPYSSQAQDRFVISTLQLSGSLCLWGASLVVNLLVGSLPGRKSGLLVVNLLVGSPQPSARQACSVYPRSASLCLSGPLWAFLGLSKPASPPSQPPSQPANSASQPASQLPGRIGTIQDYLGLFRTIQDYSGLHFVRPRRSTFSVTASVGAMFWRVLGFAHGGANLVLEGFWSGPKR